MFAFLAILFGNIKTFPEYLCYVVYDRLRYYYYRLYMNFYGWGIHLYTGRFGASKTCSMTIEAYELCLKYPQLHVLTNMNLKNFPEHTKILKLEKATDILNAPKDTIVLIDEIGTIFNSRDFSKGSNAVPKPLFQHLCQCRHRRMMILATVQRFNLLDKQIRDITADVTTCQIVGQHPFSRKITLRTFDIDEYETYNANQTYVPIPMSAKVLIQKNLYRMLYDTTEMVNGFLSKEFLTDEEILANQVGSNVNVFGDKDTQKALRRRKKY